jgi:hypothetical protein
MNLNQKSSDFVYSISFQLCFHNYFQVFVEKNQHSNFTHNAILTISLLVCLNFETSMQEIRISVAS